MKLFNLFQIGALILLMTGCSGEDAQHKERLSTYISAKYTKMPVTLKSITVETTENIGDSVDIKMKSRVRTEWEFNQDIYHYSTEQRFGRTLAVTSEKTASRLKGEGAVIYFRTLSNLKGNEWEHVGEIQSVTLSDPSLHKNVKNIGHSILKDRSLPDDTLVRAVLLKNIDKTIFFIDSDAYKAKISQLEAAEAEVQELREQRTAEGDNYYTKKNLKSIMELGESIYIKNCLACHQRGGEGIPNVFPAIKGSTVATGNMEKHIDVVTNGVPGTAMQAFGNLINIEDMAAVITYERNAFGNKTGDIAKPNTVLKVKER